MSPTRLILDPPAGGVWNMSVDEALLERADLEGVATLRFYQWEAPTLSLGYFQAYAQRRAHAPSAQCPVVRRRSGGGAIVHDQELTYSVALPADRPLARRPLDLYCAVHRALVAVIGEQSGLACRVFGDSEPPPPGEPFLCFLRRSSGDVVASDCGAKLCGAAQRRRRGAVLQHGSILLGRSVAAPELAGLADLSGRAVDADRLRDPLIDRLTALLGGLEPATLGPAEQEAAARIADQRFADRDWTQRR
ncbi:Octanoyltransferase LipM [Pirellulimonas nuda]|uniref:Octanoyltransferase LipM n=1 Tax=Pirellulimonas nuda TaxID=2528009 RepID=A0A518D7N8_9BACT|nr:lipoate--protein ligase family protein [Pirellulimonas nuda]QDU87497.1 Octanoyltransferase LipM [Pirellulimonas nuda]